jgi:Domain of unknown function (DUF397)
MSTVDLTVQWRKSSRSGGANNAACVEVAAAGSGFQVRDSKDPGGETLTIGVAGWDHMCRMIFSAENRTTTRTS